MIPGAGLALRERDFEKGRKKERIQGPVPDLGWVLFGMCGHRSDVGL